MNISIYKKKLILTYLFLVIILILSIFVKGKTNISFPDYKQSDSSDNSDIGIRFHGKCNDSIYIVKVSSPYEIFLEDFDYDISINIIGLKPTSLAYFTGPFITNRTWFSGGVGGVSESVHIGDLRYSSFKFGNFQYTTDKRYVTFWSGECGREKYWDPFKPVLSPGSWYFVYTGGVYDLSQDDVSIRTEVWINFSDECKDLEIVTSSGGKVYALWYGEFDANVIYSKSWAFELMLNGKANFYINNTFMYRFVTWPISQGFWKAKLESPEVIYKLNMAIIRRFHIPDINSKHKCFQGIGSNGNYKLVNSYLDYSPLINPNNIDGKPRYFMGVDVKLT